MVLKILLVITMLLQMVAVGMAIRMTKVTKFNSSWILFAIALTLMLFQLVFGFLNMFELEFRLPKDLFVWVSVMTTLCFVVAIFYVRKLIYYIAQMDANRRLTEKRILNTIISTEEKERIRFSKDLHDGLGPLLSSVKLSVSALSKMEPDDSKREIIRNADYAIEEAIKSLKEISNNISPHILNNFGVSRAVTNFINKLTLPPYLKINFQTNIKGQRFSSNIEAILYRVICELVNNAIKHADPSSVDVVLTLEDKENIQLTVSDNGCGFDPEADRSRGMGLSNIGSRISSLKGDMTIDSSPGSGTRVAIRISVN
ncbi:MAG: sensor histidine kinase [Rikenellaceae bacterium]|nr:sensor histidine kinase [Rikenellaceae bacterium]